MLSVTSDAMDVNFINFKNEELDKSIYRVFTRQRFMQLFETRQLTLVRPKLWDDPFENFILNATGELEDGIKFQTAFREYFYGQCWTLKRESDAIWRIYSPDKDGVKAKTTIRKLFTALYSSAGKFQDLSCFIGKVQYSSTKKLLELLSDPNTMKANITDPTGRRQASTLLLKRIAFSHEREVRLIYESQRNIHSDIFQFAIDPFELFDQIVFDPRMDYSNFKTDKNLLKSWGFKKSIVKSILYKVPELSFKM